MLKLKIALVLMLAVVYYSVTYCVLSPDICRYYSDYYFTGSRTFSTSEESVFQAAEIQLPSNMYQKYAFNSQNRNLKLLGFVGFDESGRWTNGNTAKISLRLAEMSSDLVLNFDVDPYVNDKNQKMLTEIYIDDYKVGEWNFKYGRKKPETVLRISRKLIGRDMKLNLIFKINGICSPKSLGFGQEHRKLGLNFNTLEILPER